MTFKPRTVTVSRENKMSIKDLLEKKITKTYKFMGEAIKIAKLTVEQVEALKDLSTEDKTDDLEVMNYVIKESAEDFVDITDEEFKKFPLDELVAISTSIMEFSGIGDKAKGK